MRANREVPKEASLQAARDPEPPFQGSDTTLSRIRGAMPRAVLGRPVGAEAVRTERREASASPFASLRLLTNSPGYSPGRPGFGTLLCYQ